MIQVYILLGSRPKNVIEFVTSITPYTEAADKVRFYYPEGLNGELPASPHMVRYPSPGTQWHFPKDSDHTFFIYIDPRGDLIEELDAIHDGLVDAHVAPNRVITFVDCEASEQSRKIRDYNEACIYHSDIVLLANRDNVAKKWVQDYQKSFHKNSIPAHFAFLKKDGKVDDPKYFLFPETLRMSQLFDIDEGESDDLPIEIEASFDLDSQEDDPLDPYRNADGEDYPQQRVPNISDLIE